MSAHEIKIRQGTWGGMIAADLLKRGENLTWLVCLHGLQSNRQMFQDLAKDTRFSQYNIVAFDLVGFGDSSKPRQSFDYDILSQTAAVLEALKVERIERAIWIGHSLGGMVATLAIREAPASVAAVISLEGNLALVDCGKSAEVAAVPFETFQAQYANQPGGTPDYVFYQSSHSIVKWSKSGELLRVFEGSPVPALLIKGAKSHFKSRPQGNNVNVVDIPEAGHFMMREALEVTLASIVEFIAKANE